MSSEPSEAELLRRAIENRLLDLHTQIPAVVESYDQEKQTIDAKVCVKRAIASDDEETVFEEIPILRNIKVMFPRGGGFCMTWPLSKGDPVRLVFDEAYTGQYANTGVVPSEPGYVGRFNLSSCVAYPGAGADKDALLAVAEGTLIIGFDGQTSDGGPAQIHIVNDGESPALIRLGPDVTSKVALAKDAAMVLSDIIDTIKTATASGTETGLAAIIAHFLSAYPSTPAVRESDIGAVRVYAQ